MSLLPWVGVFILSLITLLKSAEWFTDTAEKVGLHFKLSPFIIGVTIVAMGTSLPEIATSIIAVLNGHSEIVIGNVVGSNIANILFVLSITAIIAGPLVINKNIIRVDLPILLGSSVLLYITTLNGHFNYLDGIISIVVLITYLAYNATSEHKVEKKELRELSLKKTKEKKRLKKDHLALKYPLYLAASGAVLYLSANYTIESVIKISEFLKIGTELIAISAIAIGTSLPELAVSLAAAKKGKVDIAIGNITGSNIFNALGVMGVSSIFGPLEIPNNFVQITIPILLTITILYIFVTIEKHISKWEGITLLLIYVAFMGKTFGLI